MLTGWLLLRGAPEDLFSTKTLKGQSYGAWMMGPVGTFDSCLGTPSTGSEMTGWTVGTQSQWLDAGGSLNARCHFPGWDSWRDSIRNENMSTSSDRKHRNSYVINCLGYAYFFIQFNAWYCKAGTFYAGKTNEIKFDYDILLSCRYRVQSNSYVTRNI